MKGYQFVLKLKTFWCKMSAIETAL